MDAIYVGLISLIAFCAIAFITISTIRTNRLEKAARERIPSTILDALEPKWFWNVHSLLMTSVCVMIIAPSFDEVVSTVNWLIGIYFGLAILHGWFFFRTRRLGRKLANQIPEGSMGVVRWAEITHGGFSLLAGVAGIATGFIGS